jgi:chromate reductase
LQAIFGYRNAYIYPERVFIPGVGNALGEDGRLKDAEMLGRLRKQAKGFGEFAAKLRK